MVGRRHVKAEITAKLAQANELAAKGKTQREISKVIGVSIMTYHRWKKMTDADDDFASTAREEVQAQFLTSSGGDVGETIQRLRRENSRLRRLVTDILLEKIDVEEEFRTRQEP
jgi:putative transposase